MEKEIVGVRFKQAGRIYYFAPMGINLKAGENVIVETVRGVEFGLCEIENKLSEVDENFSELKPVLRVATENDIKQNEKNKEDVKEIFAIFNEKVQKHELEMTLVDIEYTFDRSKLLFYFTADKRIDFRELVKDLASIYKTRIELRQIRVRDQAKIISGLGICGKTLCCSTFLGDFNHVSIKMAKDQSLSLNPTKISGACGRLMCCLKFEQDTYEKLNKELPKVSDFVQTPEGKGTVITVATLRGKVRVLIEQNGEKSVVECDASDVVVLKTKREKHNERLDKELEKGLKEILD